MNPDILAVTLKQLEPQIPQLISSEQWAILYPQYAQYRDQLQPQNNRVVRLQAAANLIDLFAPFQALQTQIRSALESYDVYRSTLTELAAIARKLNSETRVVAELEKAAAFSTQVSQTRLIILHGVGQKAQSFKWQNFEFHFGNSTEVAQTAAGILAAYKDIIDPDSDYLLMTAGVLLIISGILSATKVEITAQDASVFWGLIQAQRHHALNRVDIINVTAHTNQERANVHLPPLSEQQIRHSLHNLVMMSCVVQTNEEREIWRVIEKYKSKV